MSDESDSEMELYGVSPWVIAQLMFIITLVVPIGAVATNGTVFLPMLWVQGPFMYGFLWAIDSSYYGSFIGFSFLNLPFMWTFVPLSAFSILYVRQIVRYYQGKSSRDSALMVGLLSLVFPSLTGLISTLLIVPISQAGLIIPIPIQFIVGLVFLSKLEGPEVISPWQGQFIDWSWWKRLRTTWSNRSAHIIEMYLDEEEETD